MSGLADLICFSHLRWNFVYQRPNHLMSRCARERRVFYFEEPIFDASSPRLEINVVENNLYQVTPHLPEGMGDEQRRTGLARLVDQLIEDQNIQNYLVWYYTPMALEFTGHLKPKTIIFDVMDELSAFRGAPKILLDYEAQLFKKASVVFTGGMSLYESKRTKHPFVHAFPSSVDRAHFGRARTEQEPADQARIPGPKLGFFGVIDERFDIELLRGAAAARPNYQWVVIGPIVKIDPNDLPKAPNIHYLGSKTYNELPAYLSGWDVALLLFAMNESTRFISPTKTPEYLAAGRPVVSTPIRDVVSPYGDRGLVRIASNVPEWVAACDAALKEGFEPKRQEIDAFLRDMSWDETWRRMSALIEGQISDGAAKNGAPKNQEEETCSTI
jgi:UDP-galactopyranose mutase